MQITASGICPICEDVHREHRMSPADVSFMGRMLGVHTCQDCDADECADVYIRRHMADPVANARARQRIGDLLALCGQIERAASTSYAGTANDAAPLTSAEASRLHAIDEYSNRVQRFFDMAVPSAGIRVERSSN